MNGAPKDHADKILEALSSGNPMTAMQIAEASGVPAPIVATYIGRLCMADKAKCISRSRPMIYQASYLPAKSIVEEAIRTQPNSVFDIARTTA